MKPLSAQPVCMVAVMQRLMAWLKDDEEHAQQHQQNVGHTAAYLFLKHDAAHKRGQQHIDALNRHHVRHLRTQLTALTLAVNVSEACVH